MNSYDEAISKAKKIPLGKKTKEKCKAVHEWVLAVKKMLNDSDSIKNNYNDNLITMEITEINGNKFLLIEQKNNVIYVPEFKFKQFIKGIEYLFAGLEANNED